MNNALAWTRCPAGWLIVWLLLIGSLASASDKAVVPDDARPNILWITCEDISPYLGCYGCDQARTPVLDALAAEGIRYTHAYANAPVCAVARSTLLTGLYASTIGTHQMRSFVTLPPSVPVYPKLLRQAGYYCTNNSKKDYNSPYNQDSELWDESSNKAHWRNRRPGQPFFAVFNITDTHESRLQEKVIAGYVRNGQIPRQPRVRPSDIQLPPYHPDLPAIRRDWARLHDLITLMDGKVGRRLRELKEDGLADNTIVFFYSDHGGMLARAKRFIYNVGTQVPLIVKFPPRWQLLAPAEPGTACDRLVSFVDFPKTLLSLAGVAVPPAMQGRIFLGRQIELPESTVHFYRDRMAERTDFSRAVTDGRFYYIRNFMPHRPRGRDSRYGPQVQANWRAWEAHFDAGKCDPIQSQFYRPKPSVQLFDTKHDPWHVHNLAGDPKYRDQATRLEAELRRWMVATRDLGLLPESMFTDLIGSGKPWGTLYEYGAGPQYPVKRLLDAAWIASLADPRQVTRCVEMTDDAYPAIRYWGAYGLFLLHPDDRAVIDRLQQMAEHDELAANRLMAAQALGRCGVRKAAFERIVQEANHTRQGYVALQALNALQYSHTDDVLSLDQWQAWSRLPRNHWDGPDRTGVGYVQRICRDAIALWPRRRKVD